MLPFGRSELYLLCPVVFMEANVEIDGDDFAQILKRFCQIAPLCALGQLNSNRFWSGFQGWKTWLKESLQAWFEVIWLKTGGAPSPQSLDFTNIDFSLYESQNHEYKANFILKTFWFGMIKVVLFFKISKYFLLKWTL